MSVNVSEIRLYTPRGLFYTGQAAEPVKRRSFTPQELATGQHLETPELIPLDVQNEGFVTGTVRDFGVDDVPYKVRIWILAEYEPEKL